jgi:glutamyl-tRNA synthetase
MADPEAIRAALLRHALSNAIKYGGKANPNAVAGMAFSEDPSLKANTKDVFRLAAEVASEVNRMGLDAIKAKAESMGVGAPKEKPKQVERILPALPNASKFKIIKVRFAPNPDSVIHLGNTRAALLSDDYAKMYGGSFVLRFEDTSPSIKPPQAEAYEIIRQDLKWLGVHWDEEAIQSDRLPIYYDHAR